MLDAPLRRFLFTRMPTTVVLNGELKGYTKLVADTHAQFPSLEILRYSNAQRVPEGTRVACTMFPYFYRHAKDLALIRTDGSPKITGGPGALVVWTDITLPETRDYIVSHIAEQVANHGTDGVAIDSFHTDLNTNESSKPLVQGEAMASRVRSASSRAAPGDARQN